MYIYIYTIYIYVYIYISTKKTDLVPKETYELSRETCRVNDSEDGASEQIRPRLSCLAIETNLMSKETYLYAKETHVL